MSIHARSDVDLIFDEPVVKVAADDARDDRRVQSESGLPRPLWRNGLPSRLDEDRHLDEAAGVDGAFFVRNRSFGDDAESVRREKSVLFEPARRLRCGIDAVVT